MGLANLVAALPRVLDRAKRVKLYLAGEGPERPALERQIAELGLGRRARLLGRVSAEDLPRLYTAADLFVLPTCALEGFGLATLEALACGTAVAATPVGGTPEWLAKLDRRMVTTDATSGAIADGILRMLGVSRTGGDDLRRRCRAYAEQFAWSRIAHQFEGELGRLLETAVARRETHQWLPT
jgi:glycosyltransferase involved in cell wall biosynthesis